MMKVISVIEDKEVIKKILKHLGLRDSKSRPPPRVALPANIFECKIDYSSSQLLPDFEKWFYSDPEYSEIFFP